MNPSVSRRRLQRGYLSVALYLVLATVPAFGAFKFLDDSKKVIYVLHDSVNPTSRLKSWVEQYFGGAASCPVKVVEGTQGRYLAIGYLDGQLTATGWVKAFSADAVRTAAGVGSDWPVAVVALTNFRENDFVRGPQDTTGVSRIAGELKFACDELVKRGAAKVIWSTYHFNYSHRRLAEHEPLVVDAFRKLTGDHLAADMVTPTVFRTSGGVNTMSGDRRHGTHMTFAQYGYTWFKTMADHDGIAVPAWCSEWLENGRQKTLTSQGAMRVVSPTSGKYRVGDKMTVKWEMDYGASLSGVWSSGTLDRVGVALEFRRTDMTNETRPLDACWTNLFETTNCPTGSRSLPTICASPTQKTYETTITITEGIFTGAKVTTMPFPVNVIVSSPDLWKEHYATSTVDWNHPENMIVLYPSGVDLNAPLYPNGLTVHMARRSAPVYQIAPWSGCTLRLPCDRGRSLGTGDALPGHTGFFDLQGKLLVWDMSDRSGRSATPAVGRWGGAR